MKRYAAIAWIAAGLLILSMVGCQPSEQEASSEDSATESVAESTVDVESTPESEDTGAEDTTTTPSADGTTAPAGTGSSSTKKPGSTKAPSKATTKDSGSKTTVVTTKKATTTKFDPTYPAAPNGNFKYQTSTHDKSGDMKFLVPVSENFTTATPKDGGKLVNGVYNALDFGATPNDLSDDSDALNQAFNYAGTNAPLYIPAGLYIINRPLYIASNVQVVGDFTAPGCASPTVFLAYYGHGDEDAEPLITMGDSSSIRGIQIYYPKQDKKSPVEYPPTIKSTDPDTTVDTVFIVNPWEALDFKAEAGRHFIRNVYSQPLKLGLSIDNCLDVGRLRNIQFRAYWSATAAEYQRENAVGIDIGRSDWQYVDTVYMENMKSAWYFSATTSNVLLNDCTTAACYQSVLVEGSRTGAGLIFSDCRLDGQFRVSYTNAGTITLKDCVLTANKYSAPLLNIHGLGTFIMRNCFADGSKSGDKSQPVLRLNTDQAIVSGNTFVGSGVHILIDAEVKGATLVGNVVPGGTLNLEDNGPVDYPIA